ncbi:MAG TPA: hydroxyisourate hydrolase [Solirubrobacteraceae bacterium]|nr:hydroxyisourate hydrolase [Solirubrobacteraceae bacterium]
MSLSTHVLDATSGAPAVGIAVRVETQHGDHWHAGPEHRTDHDGRISAFDAPAPGVHRIRFDTGAYFAAKGIETFYPEVAITFLVNDAQRHHHVPLLLSPFAFSTYRGS